MVSLGSRTRCRRWYRLTNCIRSDSSSASQASELMCLWGSYCEIAMCTSLRNDNESNTLVAKNSTRYIVLDRPDLIEKEVPLFIKEIRGSAPPLTTYGSTITE